MSYVTGSSLGEAYFEALKAIMEGGLPHWYLTVHCARPILADAVPKTSIDSLAIDRWRRVLNLGDGVYKAFTQFDFGKHDSWSEDCSGKGWIQGRIMSLLDDAEGDYKESLSRAFGFDQLLAVENRLAARDRHGRKIHGGSVNGLVCSVYVPTEDLRKACKPRPRMNDARCLAQIDFKPIGDRLNLMAVFRSQYFDTKAYGNFISLAMLLYTMCERTGYKPGAVVSTANKVVFHGRPRPLYRYLVSKLNGDSGAA